MKIFNLSSEYSVVCDWQKTRYGFRHLATLCSNGQEIGKTKCCYYNRTWEKYEYQSVLQAIIRKYFEGAEQKAFLKYAEEYSDCGNGHLKAVAAVCAFGEIICEKQKEKNDWKKKMMGTIPGIIFPDDWDNLPEEEKQKRLDGALSQIGE